MPKTRGASSALYLLVLTATWLAFFTLRFFAPSELMDNDQERPSAYALDAAVNGHWIVQTDDTGDITSKPPLYTWLIAAGMKALGNGSTLALELPGALSILGCTLLILFAGQRFFGGPAGFLGAIAYLLSMAGVRQLLLIRTDPLFSFTVTVMLILALYAAMGRVSWLWFWVAAALSTLTKGPLGLLLFLGVIPVIAYEIVVRRRGRDGVAVAPSLRENAMGLVVFLVIAGGWFLAAYISVGHALIDKMIGQELVGHAMESQRGAHIGDGLWKPSLYFITRSAPWSLLIFQIAWRLLRKPSTAAEERLAERIIGGLFLFGMIIFSLSPHQRPDHLYPLLPAFSMLGGRELAAWIPNPRVRFFRIYAVAVVVLLFGFGGYYYVYRPYDEAVQDSKLVADFANELKTKSPGDFPYVFSDVPYALQFHMGVMRLETKRKDAAATLDAGHPAYVITGSADKLRDDCRNPDSIRVIDSWPPRAADGNRYQSHPFLPFTKKNVKASLFLVTNQPADSADTSFGTRMGTLLVGATNARIDSMTNDAMAFTALKPDGAVEFLNDGDEPARIRVSMKQGEGVRLFSHTIAPGARWIVDQLSAH